MKRWAWMWLILTVALAGGGRAQSPLPNQTASQTAAAVAPASVGEVRQRTFDIVWTRVRDKHFDPTLGGLNWERVREQYAPRVTEVKSDAELYALLQQMLGELRQSHFSIIPPEAVVDAEAKEPTLGGVGLDLRIIDGEAVITRVETDSPAARAGLRPGFIIKQVDGKPVTELAAAFAKGTQSDALKRVRLERAVKARIGGRLDGAVKLDYLDAKDQAHAVELVRERLQGEMSPPFGNFPSQYTEFEARRLASGLGYIRFNVFVTSLQARIRAAIREFHAAPGLIFDLRGNPGGIGGMASGIAGHLCSRPGSLGKMQMRAGYTNFAVFPQTDPYEGQIVILIDGSSGSTSEVFTSGMQELGRAVVIGERSAGAALPSLFEKLPTGALFQYAIADFKTPQGVLIEGRGVIPDIDLKWNRAALLAGRDAQLDAAVERLSRKRAAAAK